MNPTKRISVIPQGVTRISLKPTELAYRIKNLSPTTAGTLRTPAPGAPYDLSTVITDTLYSIYHTVLAGREMLLLHQDNEIKRFCGWIPSIPWQTVATDCPDDKAPKYRDQWVDIAGTVVWNSGSGNTRMRAILPDGRSYVLGFSESEAPSPPLVEAPSEIGHTDTDRERIYPNSKGYSWPGSIGTVGDEISLEEAKLLHGEWYYYTQLEDLGGNLSPLSNPSAAAQLYSQVTINVDTAFSPEIPKHEEIDDLLKQFAVKVSTSTAPQQTVAVRLGRTKDARNVSVDPYLLTRMGGIGDTVYPDSKPDSGLSIKLQDVVGVPQGCIICEHRGKLVMGNIAGSPSKVMISETGFPGTFLRDSWVIPDEKGEVTGLISFGGKIISFTPFSTTAINEDLTTDTIFNGIGCISPTSVKIVGNRLCWLALDGVYSWDGISLARISEDIDDIFETELNKGLFRLAHATVYKGEYYLALATAGSNVFNVIHVWNPMSGWRELDYSYMLGYGLTSMTVTADERNLMLYTYSSSQGTSRVYVYDRGVRAFNTNNWDSEFTSNWLRADDVGLTSFRVKQMFIRFVETGSGTVNVKFYKNDSFYPQVGETLTFNLCGNEYLSTEYEDETWRAGNDALLGTTRIRTAPSVWRRIPAPPELNDCFSWSFTIETSVNQVIELAAFAFDIELIANDRHLRMRD